MNLFTFIYLFRSQSLNICINIPIMKSFCNSVINEIPSQSEIACEIVSILVGCYINSFPINKSQIENSKYTIKWLLFLLNLNP